jgi:hypothetical protein
MSSRLSRLSEIRVPEHADGWAVLIGPTCR